jgi:hypothetical protein
LVRLYAALARTELAADDAVAAREAIREAEAVEAEHGRCMTCTLDLENERIRVALTDARFEAAENGAAGLEALAQRFGSTSCRAMAHLARARIGARRGTLDAAHVDFLAASKAYVEAGRAVDAAAVDAEAARLCLA